jgi:uncharacterized protein YprB with RNaseH-like and TPR domain
MRKCLYDGCHEFEPSTYNHAYCMDCKCKRKEENRKKGLEKSLEYDEETFELQEKRKRALLERKQARNTWILQNKSFASFDIETTDLKADGGRIICASIKPWGGPVETYYSELYDKKGGDDSKVIEEIRDRLREFDYVITWYGTGFDMPFLKTRLLINNMEPLGEMYHVDLYYTSRFHFLFNNNRMQTVEEALFAGKTLKTRLSRMVWADAISFDWSKRKIACEYIADHCEKDVESLEGIFNLIGEDKDLSSTPLRKY